MLFSTDQQTMDDLNIFGKPGSISIFTTFNHTASRGGALLMEEMFRHPLSDPELINRRIGIMRYFASLQIQFPFDRTSFDSTDQYLNNRDERTKLSAEQQSAAHQLSNLIAGDMERRAIEKGIISVAGLLKILNSFVHALDVADGQPYHSDKVAILSLLSDPAFASFLIQRDQTKFSFVELARLDEVFRFQKREVIQQLLGYVFQIDLYLTVAKIAAEQDLIFPKALSSGEQQILLEGLYHPLVAHAVPNDILITPQSNVVFLTGANMAGKSTFMKSLTVAMYMAHMGFPVAASKMEFSVLDGIYTTINLPDDLGMGASHFYAEVLRAKKIANELQRKKLFVVFDELFRGTNVKNACEGTIAFTEAFAKRRDSVFVLSTHIIEAGEVIKKHCSNVNFVYLPTLMEGGKPSYSYQLQQGITEDRHGMVIIHNEGILELLTAKNTSQVESTGDFTADSQTLSDLNLLGKYKSRSIFSLFNQVKTAGGERLLQEMFHRPLTDSVAINRRSRTFDYFQQLNLAFPLQTDTFTKAENYLSMGTAGSFPASAAGLMIQKLKHSILGDEQFEVIRVGLTATIAMLNIFSDFIDHLEPQHGNIPHDELGVANDAMLHSYEEERQVVARIFADHRLRWLKKERDVQQISLLKVARYDYLLKHVLRDHIDALLDAVYRLDVYIAVSDVARDRGFNYAAASPKEANKMSTTALWHPSIVNGISNSVKLWDAKNMIFLTGANMAGKSTLMKAFGIAMYLAHMGFPVAAKDMHFSVRDGLYSSINVPDNIDKGYSHFYAEVLRVKAIAEAVAAGKHLTILFDELFKGTNVKDAYDGTLAVIDGFARHRNCSYIVSTHIIEVGKALASGKDQIQFAYLPTIMQGKVPHYTYKLQQGITTDRQGMIIIENEGILDML